MRDRMYGKRKIEVILKTLENWYFFRGLCCLSTILYLAELSTGTRDTYESHWTFLWGERIVATIFTIEYFLRWYDDATDEYGWHYPQSWMGIIDLISILPFWVGFFVPREWLHFVRTFRVFRLLKFFRYSRSLQLVALGFYRAWHHLRALGFTMLIVSLFCSVAIFEIEKDAQPDKLGTLMDAMYFTAVTVATVGYGDISPITPLGRIVTMITFFFALSIFAGMLGVLGNSFVKVLEEEADLNVDPIKLYHQEQERQLEMRSADKKFMPKYTQLEHDDRQTFTD